VEVVLVALQASKTAPTPNIYLLKFKISFFLWLLARHIQLNKPIALSRSAIIDLLGLEGGGLTEVRVLHQAMQYGMLKRKEHGLYIPNYEVADTLVHRIPVGVVEGMQRPPSNTRLWREAIRLRHAWADYVKWVKSGMSPTDLPVESIAVLETFGIKPFVEVKAPNGKTAYTVQFKDIYLINRRLSGAILLFCADFPQQGQGAKLCATKEKVLRRYLL
jgi:hypothetical protein